MPYIYKGIKGEETDPFTLIKRRDSKAAREKRGRLMNIAEKAVKQNEIIELLEGKNGYQLGNDRWASVNAPIDWTRVVPMLYEIYAKNNSVKEMYEDAIGEMLRGGAEDYYCGIAVLYFQILRENAGRAPFSINRDKLIAIAKNNVIKNEKELKQIHKWSGQASDNGLWDEVDRYRRLLLSKFGIAL